MQHLSHDQITAMAQPIPMSRDDKLERWALINRTKLERIFIFHRLEYRSHEDLTRLANPGSAFASGAADPVLKVAGLNSECVGEGMRFFELSKDDVHAFSCDCSGSISNSSMAGRVRGLKSSVPKTGIKRLLGWLKR